MESRMIDHTDVDYRELEDAAGWMAEAPWLLDGNETPGADELLAAAAKLLDVDTEGLWQFACVSVAAALNDCGLGAAELDVLLDQRQREFFVLLGVAAGRGKCPGP
jgi:hypothetical protein